jgi:tetratricopeptide (TPR) repeat protein
MRQVIVFQGIKPLPLRGYITRITRSLGNLVIRETRGHVRATGKLVQLTAIGCLAFSGQVLADAQASFEDGNRLFRDDLYWAALLRYQEAGEAGMDTPLLHFNTGVAHYKAQQHIRARESLLKAAESPQLRVISHYNLGLNAYASGDPEEALDWFRRARDQQENETIREYAMAAIGRVNTEVRTTDPVIVAEVKRREEEKPVAGLDVRAKIGYGSDDNVFRAPAEPYIDLSDPALPIVVPEIFSGAFVPVELRAGYHINTTEHEKFFGAYRLDARFYDGDTENNADEYFHELRFGSEYDRREDSRVSRVYSAFAIAEHDGQYVDPDTGNPRTAGGQEITDRMDYVRYGPELNIIQRFGGFGFGFRMKGQLWDYEDTEVVPEYDHEFFVFGGHVQYKLPWDTLFRLTIEKSSRRYAERPSFDLNGDQLITNPALRYDYLEYAFTARQRIVDSFWFGFGYALMDREDRYVGYNDFSRDSYNFEVNWSPGRRFNLAMNAWYRVYDYPNAFAFNNPVAGEKTLETIDSEILATFLLSDHFWLEAEIDYRETASTDTRIEYDRTRYSLSLVWEL